MRDPSANEPAPDERFESTAGLTAEHAAGQMSGQTAGQTSGQAAGQTSGQTSEPAAGQASRQTGRPAAGQTAGRAYPAAGAAIQARRILLRGRVQGVGFRPFVHRLASGMGLSGWVRNLSGQVIVHAEGPADRLDAFASALLTEAPGLARPEIVSASAAVPTGIDTFFVEASEAGETVDVSVPPDIALCADCRREVWDPNDRRYRYPFVNCTQCGPRYTIIASLPYDRAQTSMEKFALCPACRTEYEDIEDRRYHAEPIACPACGPRVELVASASGERETPSEPLLRDDALRGAVDVLESGGVLALQGIGGYHLLCDATSEAAVRTLRERKRRPGRPLAVMVPEVGEDGLDAARSLIEVSESVGAALLSEARPIVIARRVRTAACTSLPSADDAATADSTGVDGTTPASVQSTDDVAPTDFSVPDEVAPGLDELGVILPYSPLHQLLLGAFGRPVVATSGNSSGEPLVFTRRDAERYLSDLADGFLHHDRPILRPIDDSVLRDFGDAVVPIRIGRGLAPLELTIPRPTRIPRLAVGGHMKSTVALAQGDRVILSPHLGDLDRPRAFDAFMQTLESLRALFRIEPHEILADAHPDYASTRWAQSSGFPVRAVFHHRAHASALAGEHPDVGRWLVFAWDGVGLGEDGTLWGGETLHGAPGRWERVGSMRPFQVLGAGRAGREPLRSAQALAWEIDLDLEKCAPAMARAMDSGTDPAVVSGAGAIARAAWQRRLGTSTTTAVGRIFDAAAAILLGRVRYDYEAQGPMELEAAAGGPGQPGEPHCVSDVDVDADAVSDVDANVGPLPIACDPQSIWRVDWEPLVRMLVDQGLSVRERAQLFHAILAETAVVLALQIHADRPFDSVGLTGGVFQNRRLSEEIRLRCRRHGLDVRIAKQVPMNDGGLAYGQIVEAVASEDGEERQRR